MIDDMNANHGESGRFATVHTPEVHLAVRIDYEMSELTVPQISDKHGVAETTIYQWAQDECWVRRRPRKVDPNDLVSRLLGLLDRQIADLERVVKNRGTEVTMLSKLVTTLDRVLALKERPVAEKPKPSKRVQELRAQIAERIGELNKD